jgi:hypothetical protein
MSTGGRDELMRRNEDEFVLLLGVLDRLRGEGRIDASFAQGGRDRNVRDVLGHLHTWHLLLERWYGEGSAGGFPAIPAEGYTWRELDALNVALRDEWARTSVEDVAARLQESHTRLQLMIAAHDDDLFDPAAYPWTGGTPLAEFCLECGGNHYAWARTTISHGLGGEPGDQPAGA